MKNVSLTCIGCPMGCQLTAELEGEQVVQVSGNTCPNGERYARKELTDPTRIVTTTVRVRGGRAPVVSVKTASDIPKGKIFDCIRSLRALEVQAPVQLGQVLAEDIAGTGVAVVATKSVG